MKFWQFYRKKEKVSDVGSCAELPVPTHLKPFFAPVPDARNKMQITGDIRCSCGCMTFAAVRSKDDDCVYHLTCADCRKDILLFDARSHGWDATVCHMPGEYTQAGVENAVCEKCGGKHFQVTVWIEPTDKAEFFPASKVNCLRVSGSMHLPGLQRI